MSGTDPLDAALRLQLDAAREGFDWRHLDELWDKLAEEVEELKDAAGESRERAQDELGDLLFMAVNLARHLGVDPGRALEHANRKFVNRFKYIMDHVDQLPELRDARRLECMERLWQEAKTLERRQQR